MKRILRLLSATLVAGVLASPAALADFEIGVVTGTGKTQQAAREEAFRNAVVKGLTQQFGFDATNPLTQRILQRKPEAIVTLFEGSPSGPLVQKDGGFVASLFFRGRNEAFEQEIKLAVEQYLRSTGGANVLSAFLVTSSKDAMLGAETEWLKSNGTYSPQAALLRANDRLRKAGDEVNRDVERMLGNFGIPGKPAPEEFLRVLQGAHVDVASRASGNDFTAIEKRLLDEAKRSVFSRAIVGTVDVDGITRRDGMVFTAATVGGRLYDMGDGSTLTHETFQFRVRGFGTSEDASLSNVLASASHDVVGSHVLGNLTRTSVEKQVYLVRLCGFDSLSDIARVKDLLKDYGRVEASEKTLYSLVEPRIKTIDDLAIDLDRQLKPQRTAVDYDVKSKTVYLGKCR